MAPVGLNEDVVDLFEIDDAHLVAHGFDQRALVVTGTNGIQSALPVGARCIPGRIRERVDLKSPVPERGSPRRATDVPASALADKVGLRHNGRMAK